MKYTEIKGNLFDLDKEYALGQCISRDCGMGAGIAVQFVKRYPKMRRVLLNMIEKHKMLGCFSLAYNEEDTDKNMVINLITKEYAWGKPTYDSLGIALKDAELLCRTHNIKKLGLPLIGCGIDGLKWDKVSEMIQEVFKDLDIEIIVCKL